MQVDDKGQTHKLFRDVVCSNIAYGAGRWLATLRRTCERMLRTEGTVPQLDHGGGSIPLIEFVNLLFSFFKWERNWKITS